MARLTAAGRLTVRTKLVAITVVLISVIAGVIVLSAGSTDIERGRALVNNVAGREPTLAHRYVEEVLLRATGHRADPDGTKDELLHDADALLDGGAVLAVQGNDEEVRLPQQTNGVVRAKLTELRHLDGELVTAGDKVLSDEAGGAQFAADVDKVKALADVTGNVGHDAVGYMTARSEAAVAANARHQIELAAIGILLALALSWTLGRRLVARLTDMTGVVRAAAEGDLAARYRGRGDDEVGQLGKAMNEMADNLAAFVRRLEADAERDGFGSQLMEAFEMVDEEPEAYTVVERAMTEIDTNMPVELLLADSSRAHLQRVAGSPTGGCPGCPVESPFSCVAVRRGTAVVFETSEALNACSKLRDRPGGPSSAVCVPVSFMGKALGVLHATGPDGTPPTQQVVDELATLAGQAGSRVGTVRAFHQTQLQATTDGLTGLLNRRTFENELRSLLQSGQRFALAFVDLDHFKLLNDTYGHEGGDRALRLFAQTLKDAVRTGDIVARYGGEEFVLVLPGTNAEQAIELIDRLRVMLGSVLEASGLPAFTASFGVTDSDAARTVDELVRLADEALMTAKAEGRNRVVARFSDRAHARPPAPDQRV